MQEELKAGDVVILKNDHSVSFTIVQIDIDKINANCIDSKGQTKTLPLIVLEKKQGGFTNPIYLG